MTTPLPLDFHTDREQKQVTLKRAFKAPLPKVWRAWTEAQYLDQWWAPAPWKAETSHMDFKAGGYWLYAMVSPEGARHYGRVDYSSVRPQQGFEGYDGFCDAAGNLDPALPRTAWKVAFESQGQNTMATVLLTFKTLEDLEQLVKMGFKEGFTIALQGLDELLQKD